MWAELTFVCGVCSQNARWMFWSARKKSKTEELCASPEDTPAGTPMRRWKVRLKGEMLIKKQQSPSTITWQAPCWEHVELKDVSHLFILCKKRNQIFLSFSLLSFSVNAHLTADSHSQPIQKTPCSLKYWNIRRLIPTNVGILKDLINKTPL